MNWWILPNIIWQKKSLKVPITENSVLLFQREFLGKPTDIASWSGKAPMARIHPALLPDDLVQPAWWWLSDLTCQWKQVQPIWLHQAPAHSSTSRILHCLVPDFVWLGRKNTGNKMLSFFMPFTKSELPISFSLIWTMHAGQRMKASQQLHNCLIHTATGFARL